IRWQAPFRSERVEVAEMVRLSKRELLREFHFTGIPAGHTLALRQRVPNMIPVKFKADIGEARSTTKDDLLTLVLVPDKQGTIAVTMQFELPPAGLPPTVARAIFPDSGKI